MFAVAAILHSTMPNSPFRPFATLFARIHIDLELLVIDTHNLLAPLLGAIIRTICLPPHSRKVSFGLSSLQRFGRVSCHAA